jgi:hypothetical protein
MTVENNSFIHTLVVLKYKTFLVLGSKVLKLFLGTVASSKFWSSMSFQNLVRLSQI